MAQDEQYREDVLPAEIERRLIIEAALPMGWEKIVGPKGVIIGLDDFGVSAPGELVMEKRGISTDAILSRAEELLMDNRED